ncbi:bidirectional sugar transporter sweet1, partial [Quercus suber]
MQNTAHLVFGIFGNATALFLFLAPMYGLPLVSKNNLLVSTINGTGAGIEIIYVLIFIVYAPKKERTKILGLFAFVLTFFAAVALISLLALHDNPRKLFCGFATAVFSIIMYGSPLSIMVRIDRTLIDLVSKIMPQPLDPGSLILYFIYRRNKGKGKNENKNKNSAVVSMELGLPKEPNKDEELSNTNGAQNGH